jgi:hypothetical protein
VGRWFALLFFAAGVVAGAGGFAAATHPGQPDMAAAAAAAAAFSRTPPPGVDWDLPIPLHCEAYPSCPGKNIPGDIGHRLAASAKTPNPMPMPTATADGLVGMPLIGSPGQGGGNINGELIQRNAGHPVGGAPHGYTVVTLYEAPNTANGQGAKDRLMQSIWLKDGNKYPVYTCEYNYRIYCTPPPTARQASKK